MERNIDKFFDEVSEGLHAYINHPFFKNQVLANTDSFTRVSIKNELDNRIEEKMCDWLKGYFEQIFQRTLMDELIKKFESIHMSLHSIKDNLKGLKSPFNVDRKLFGEAASYYSRFSPNPSLARNTSLARTNVGFTFIPLAARFTLYFAGAIFISKLEAANIRETFKNIRENAFVAKMGILTKENIKHSLKEKYSEAILNMIKQFLEGDLQTEINKIRENVLTMTDKRDFYTSAKETLTELLTTVTENIDRLQELGTSVIYHKTV